MVVDLGVAIDGDWTGSAPSGSRPTTRTTRRSTSKRTRARASAISTALAEWATSGTHPGYSGWAATRRSMSTGHGPLRRARPVHGAGGGVIHVPRRRRPRSKPRTPTAAASGSSSQSLQQPSETLRAGVLPRAPCRRRRRRRTSTRRHGGGGRGGRPRLPHRARLWYKHKTWTTTTMARGDGGQLGHRPVGAEAAIVDDREFSKEPTPSGAAH